MPPGCSPRSTPTRWPRCRRISGRPNGHWIGIAARSTVFAYNKTQADRRTSCRSRCWTSPIRPGRAAGPRRPSGADFQAIVSALLQLKGEPATAAWLKAMKENATPYKGNSVAMKARQCRRDRGCGHLSLLLLRRPGQDRREQQQRRRCTISGNQDPGAFVSISGGGVLASSKHPEQAQAFLKWITGKGGQDDPEDRRFVRIRGRRRRRVQPQARAAGRPAGARRSSRPSSTARRSPI